jgi:rhodanese-related sulfurtransferase
MNAEEPFSQEQRAELEITLPTAQELCRLGLATMINRLHHGRDHLLLCICDSGRRSLAAASLLGSLGYPTALSVAGGFQAWKKQQAGAVT